MSISSCIERQEDRTEAVQFVEQYHLQESDILNIPSITDRDYNCIAGWKSLSLYVENVTVYIAGCVVRKLVSKLKCDDCRSTLTRAGNLEGLDQKDNFALLHQKNRGGLILPSTDVAVICKLCERVCRSLLHINGDDATHKWRETTFW